jgi:hypothetical protein
LDRLLQKRRQFVAEPARCDRWHAPRIGICQLAEIFDLGVPPQGTDISTLPVYRPKYPPDQKTKHKAGHTPDSYPDQFLAGDMELLETLKR